MEDLIEFYLPKDNCMEISKFVYQEKDSWVKGLNNVKSKTSGFDANYKFYTYAIKIIFLHIN